MSSYEQLIEKIEREISKIKKLEEESKKKKIILFLLNNFLLILLVPLGDQLHN